MIKCEANSGVKVAVQANVTGNNIEPHSDPRKYMEQMFEALGVDKSSPERLAETLPFSRGDTTAGSETEFQAIVMGGAESVDLPTIIRESNYFANVIKRTSRGEVSKRTASELEKFISANPENVWNNSWARFPRRFLAHFANRVLNHDLLADKSNPSEGMRGDIGKFLFLKNGQEHLRVPLSYLLKLSLADTLDAEWRLPPALARGWEKRLDHFLNDNTSPEIHSFHITAMTPANGGGKSIARETSLRFMLTQLLVQYANEKFQLKSSGQRAVIFNSPHPPVHQKKLNRLISDSFYRELFMNPCLSGWNRGEEKYRYMHTCHEVLSRSQINTIGKLRETGIITRNLIALPSPSNISLANNGTHLSLGSMRLTEAAKNGGPGFSGAEETYLGNLSIKIVEHFLPLFVGTYSAAPYRMDFADFHPEQALSFLPHELHPTHLRMLWRRWRKKSRLKIFSGPVTPFGPVMLDRAISALFGLRGDFLPDFRLIDYLVCLLSTESSPALNGRLGNEERLKNDLMDLGIFDKRMSLYLLYKLRRQSVMGFSGFEGRHFSLFESILDDLAPAADLQTLVTLLAYKYMAQGRITHEHIPDNPFMESERRQIIFGAAIGVPTFFVRRDTNNLFMQRVLKRAKRVRHSHRYPGYLRVHNVEYQKALLELIKEDAADLIELLGMQETMRDLQVRLAAPDRHSASGKLSKGILDKAGIGSPYDLNGLEFNTIAERFYRDDLRLRHFKEAFEYLQEIFAEGGDARRFLTGEKWQALATLIGERSVTEFLEASKADALAENLTENRIRTLIYILMTGIDAEAAKNEKLIRKETARHDATPVY